LVTVLALMPLHNHPLGDVIEPVRAAELRHDPQAAATLTIHLRTCSASNLIE